MIKGIKADLIVVVYLLITLAVRLNLEEGLKGHPIISISLGLLMLLFLWALIKIKVLQPDYFGLLRKKK
jgi:hypothetical protein